MTRAGAAPRSKVPLVSVLVLVMLVCSAGLGGSSARAGKGTPAPRPRVSPGNPAAVYCAALGYEHKIDTREEGQIGMCVFPDGKACEAWAFLSGACGQEYSYCARQGYQLETVRDGKSSLSREYAVCLSASGKRLGAVHELMDLESIDLGCQGVDIQPESLQAGEEGQVYQAGALSSPPPSFDWRDVAGVNWLTPIKNQAGCGSCWAFATVGTVEAAYNLALQDPDLDLDLSEQYLVSDCHSYLSYQNCCGGSYSLANAYIRDSGVPDEGCMSYVDGAGCSCSSDCSNCSYNTGGSCSDRTCADRCGDWISRLEFITGYGSVPSNRVDIQAALVEHGPLETSVGIGGAYGGHFDVNGVYRCEEDDGANHAVMIVGYDDPGGYWIVRNSWGTGWGDGGYYKVGYGECKIEYGSQYVLVEPEISLRGNGYVIANGDATPTTDDHTDFSTADVAGGSVTRTFTIANNGVVGLVLSGIPVVDIQGAHAGDFTVTADPSSPVDALGGTSAFQITFEPSEAELQQALVAIPNSDPDRSPYTFSIQGTGLGPEIELRGGGLTILAGDAEPDAADGTDFGPAVIKSTPVSRTFEIKNPGSEALQLTGDPLLEISGPAAADFTVSADPVSPVSAGGTTTFTLQFVPGAPGLREAQISLANSDASENPYLFAVQGRGTSSFADVEEDDWALVWIEGLYRAGLTSGCGQDPLVYCPGNTVSRAEMAVFLENGIHYPDPYSPPDVEPSFGDTAGHWAEDWIEALYSDGITAGCGGGNYCPDAGTTRAQMAVFLLKSKYGGSYTPPEVEPSFGDTAGHWAQDWIAQLAAEGITAGCGGGNYCPDQSATRAEMAVFLVRTFNLPLP